MGSVQDAMNAIFCRLVLAGLIVCLGVSCTTAYDAYGRPQQMVDPAAAVVGAAAVGLLGYGLANSNNNHRGHYRSYDRHYGHGHSYGSHYRHSPYRPSHYGHGYRYSSCPPSSYGHGYRGGHRGYH